MEDLNLFRSLPAVLDFLNNGEHSNLPEVNELLNVYALSQVKKEELIDSETKNHPVIVFEGLDGSGKSTLMKILARKINCKQYSTPPESVSGIRGSFNRSQPKLRLAYYYLGNYIAANEIAVLRKEGPVIVDRFWHSTTASAIANRINETTTLPDPHSKMYRWPDDLLMPDVIFFLTTPESLRIARLSRRTNFSEEEERLKNDCKFRLTLLKIYQLMNTPKLVHVQSIQNPKKVALKVQTLLTEMDIIKEV